MMRTLGEETRRKKGLMRRNLWVRDNDRLVPNL